jgi:hypothetical protein
MAGLDPATHAVGQKLAATEGTVPERIAAWMAGPSPAMTDFGTLS